MTVTIIAPGRLPKDQVFNARCTNCGTTFQFHRDDAKVALIDRNEHGLLITCPLVGCGSEVQVSLRPMNYGRC